MDLPPKLPPQTIDVRLTPATWRVYLELRGEFMVFLKDHPDLPILAPQAAVRQMRLTQITSGWLGGGFREIPCQCTLETMIPEPRCKVCKGEGVTVVPEPEKPVGEEKLKGIVKWIGDRLNDNPAFKFLLWVRFLPELHATYSALKDTYPQLLLGRLFGGQDDSERDMVKRLLHPASAPENDPSGIIGTPGTGAMGQNFSAAHHVVYGSHDFNLLTRLQSEDRVHRFGQKHPIGYFDVIASGPNGEKTVDHTIIKALRRKKNLADYTCGAWVGPMEEEINDGPN
jgi:hypothetical protein